MINHKLKAAGNALPLQHRHFHGVLLTAIALMLQVVIFTQAGNAQTGPEQFHKGMVVCAYPDAAQVGLNILKKGGNAVDAAVAVQFALEVTFPEAGNIGGGGFMVYRSAKGEVSALDFREKAPSG